MASRLLVGFASYARHLANYQRFLISAPPTDKVSSVLGRFQDIWQLPDFPVSGQVNSVFLSLTPVSTPNSDKKVW